MLATYLSFIRFSHSVFALPFALTGALLALHRLGDSTIETIAWRFGWIVVAMVTARSAAMGFNRLADASHDGLNPRTAMRELPRGVMTRTEARVFIIVSSVLFVVAAWMLGPICLVLSPVALAIVFWYSLAKRFTNYTQFFLGLAMAVARAGFTSPSAEQGSDGTPNAGIGVGLTMALNAAVVSIDTSRSVSA